MKKYLFVLALLALSAPAMAQTPAAACDPTVLLKGITFQNLITRIKSCSQEDLKAAIDDAGKQNPPDNAALACLVPLSGIAAAPDGSGLFLKAQLFRNAKRAGLIANCLAYINSTLAP